MIDLQRFSEGFPVQAYSASQSYRVRKFINRHLSSVALASITVIALIVGLVISVTQYQRAETNLSESVARFEQVRELAQFQLFDLFDDMSKVAGNTQIRADVASKSQSYLEVLRLSRFTNDELKLDVARGYIRLARIFGVPAEPNLGDVTSARDSLSKAQEILSAFPKQSELSVEVDIVTASKMAAEGMILVHDDSDMDKAKSVTDSAMQLLDSIDIQNRTEAWFLAKRSVRYTQMERADQLGDTVLLRQLAQDMIDTIDDWPDSLKSSYYENLDRGWYYYFVGLADYIDGEFESSIEALEVGNKLLSELEQSNRNDPMLLYILAWNNYIGYGSAARFP